MGDALRWMGYDVCSWPMYRLFTSLQRRDLAALRAEIDAHDAFEDFPWTVLYKVVDQAYPGSRFILTHRQEDRWIRSMVSYNGIWPDPSRRFLMGYSVPGGYEEEHRRWYRAHNQAVRDHFADRPQALLEFNVEAGAGWQELADFLDCGTPDMPFPHFKRTNYASLVPRLNRGLARALGWLRSFAGSPASGEARLPAFDPQAPWDDRPLQLPESALWRPTWGFRLVRLFADRFGWS